MNATPNRRDFLLGTSTALAAAAWTPPATAATDEAKLALEGGPKTVPSAPRLGPRWGDPERARLDALLRQDTLFSWKGPQTEAFVQRFRESTPLRHVLPCSSGSAALHIAVTAAGIAPGDEVITTPITDIGTVLGVLYQQAVPVFADLQPDTYNLDPADVERRLTPRTRAIIAVHLCGNPCDLDALRTLADRHRLILIEDCAQAWGARHRGAPVGTVGHLACWSLQNSKHITCGDGGVVATSDDRMGASLQKFGDKGFDRVKGGLFEAIAPNYRITEAQSAIATAQLERLEAIVQRRHELGTRLSKRLAGLDVLMPHRVDERDRCAFWFYFLRLRPDRLRVDRAAFVKALAAEGVECGAGYIPVPLHQNPVFQKHGFFAGRWPLREMGLTTMDYTRVETPEAEAILRTGVRVTLHEAMTPDHIDRVADAVRKVCRHYAV